MGIVQEGPTVLYVDNAGAVELSKDAKSCHRSRHVARRYFKVRELVHAGEVQVRYVNTADNRADLLTKSSFAAGTFNKLKAAAMPSAASSTAAAGVASSSAANSVRAAARADAERLVTCGTFTLGDARSLAVTFGAVHVNAASCHAITAVQRAAGARGLLRHGQGGVPRARLLRARV